MTALTETERFYIFLVIWGLWGLASWWFYKRASVVEKRKWHPWLTFGSGVLFLVGTYFIMQSLFVLLFTLPFVLFISWWNYKRTQFCDRCGAISIPTGWGGKVKPCRLCEIKVISDRGGKVVDISQKKRIFVGAMAIFMGGIIYQMLSSQGILPFLPTLSPDESSVFFVVSLVAFAVGVLACRCPICGKFLTGGDGWTPFIPECPNCHVIFK